jgi:translation initiation factor 4E
MADFCRRNSKLSLSTNDNDNSRDTSTRVFSATKSRFGGGDSSHGNRNPLNTPLNTAGVASPLASFGLGTGAFASFGSVSKTPKTPGTAFDWGKTSANASSTSIATKDSTKEKALNRTASSLKTPTLPKLEHKEEASATSRTSLDKQHALRYSWVIYYRPPTSKNMDYEESIKPMCRVDTIPTFWAVYVHCKRPSMLPHVSDYHFFREGIRPVWEDEANKKGGKWILRLKKGVVDRYWEDLLLAMVGDQFMEASDEVCGAVISVRAQEDVLSIWTKNDGGRNIKIRSVLHLLCREAKNILTIIQGNRQTRLKPASRHDHHLEKPRRQHFPAQCH